jgi:cupin fold WbuC family metalloprotein
MAITSFTAEYLKALTGAATASPRLRQHRNIHSSYEDHCQRFLNAIGLDSYIQPHRHSLDPKTETLIAIRGLFALLTFDDCGQVQEIVHIGTEKYSEQRGISAGVDIAPGTWHTIIALEPESILLELKAGPFDPTVAKEPALWAPSESLPEASEYLTRLRDAVLNSI